MNNNDVELNAGNDPSRPIIIKRGGCLGDGLKFGCGFIAGAIFMLILMVAFFYFNTSQELDEAYKDYEESAKVEQQDIRTFNVRSKKGKATIHTGMPKDSVILLLGEPTEFMSNEYMDNISYRYGNYDLKVLQIDFENGKVKSVSQH